jgi:hypothetical protein
VDGSLQGPQADDVRGWIVTLETLSKLTGRPRLGDLILGLILRPCERCQTPTFWARPRQRSKGYCPDHALWEPSDVGTALDVLMDAFPDALIGLPPRKLWRAGQYTNPTKYVVHGRFIGSGDPIWATGYGPPPDAGPCAGCQQTIRAYGPDAHALCAECEEKRQ